MASEFWREDLKLEADLQVMSNASRSVGFGVYFCRHWCAEEQPQERLGSEISRDLMVLEFFPVLVAVQIWGGLFMNQTVHFWSDIQAVVQVVKLPDL